MFDLNDIEKATLKRRLENHKKECTVSKGGRYLTYSFTPVGIGSIIKVQCACGKIFDITDVSSW